MDIRHRFSENSWPLVESWIQESIEEFTRRRLQPPEGSLAQYPDSPGNRASSFAQETKAQPNPLSARMLQNARHDPKRVQEKAFTSSQHLPDFSFVNEMLHEQQPNRVQHNSRGNETTDSAYFTTFNPTNPSSRTGTGFPEDEPGAIDEFVNSEATPLSPGQMFQLFFDLPSEYPANPSGAQEHPDLLDLDLGGVGSAPRRSQHRQNRY
jgi:hypothetical protein